VKLAYVILYIILTSALSVYQRFYNKTWIKMLLLVFLLS